jgi:hypothetical protein
MSCPTCHLPKVADPTFTSCPDGTIAVNWPEDDPPVALVTRDLVVTMIDQWNGWVRAWRIGPSEPGTPSGVDRSGAAAEGST